MGETRRLLLLRHAQAASAPGLSDIERPLTERGERDATAVGSWLSASEVAPHLVLCSTARRARRTWGLAAGQLGSAPPVSYDPRIYEADDGGLLALVQETDDATHTLLLVGHNPAVHELVIGLTRAGEVQDHFPAASLAVVGVSSGWAHLARDRATLSAFVPPAEGR